MCRLKEKEMTTATYFFLLSLISTQHVDVEIWVGVPPLAVCVCFVVTVLMSVITVIVMSINSMGT